MAHASFKLYMSISQLGLSLYLSFIACSKYDYRHYAYPLQRYLIFFCILRLFLIYSMLVDVSCSWLSRCVSTYPREITSSLLVEYIKASWVGLANWRLPLKLHDYCRSICCPFSMNEEQAEKSIRQKLSTLISRLSILRSLCTYPQECKHSKIFKMPWPSWRIQAFERVILVMSFPQFVIMIQLKSQMLSVARVSSLYFVNFPLAKSLGV